MSVRRELIKGEKYWVVDVKEKGHPRRKIRSKKWTLAEAKRKESELRQSILEAIEKGETSKKGQSVPTLAKFEDEFIKRYCIGVKDNKPGEIARKRSLFRNHLIPSFGSFKLNKFSSASIDDYIAEKRATQSPKSIANHLVVLKTALSRAVSWGKISKADMPEFEPIKVEMADPKFLTFEQAGELVESADGFWREMIIVALHTGLRLGELRALEWGDIDFRACKIRVARSYWEKTLVSTKSRKIRTVELTDTAKRALKSCPRNISSQLVFCRPDGQFLLRSSCYPPLHRACKRAEIEKIGWHTLRHTYGTHLATKGVPLNTIQILMGHSNIATTMRYAHSMPSERLKCVRILDAGPDAIYGASSTDSTKNTQAKDIEKQGETT